jgi:hypothetical protein
LQHVHLYIKLVKDGLLRHQANAVPEVLDFEAVLSDPICFSPSSRSATTIRKVCCLLQTKSRLASNS